MRVKELDIYFKPYKIIFIYFFDSFCLNTTNLVDNFFKDKYDLNKQYLKIQVSKSKKIIEKLDVTTYPVIKIYKNNTEINELFCTNNIFIDNLDKFYNNI